MKFILLYKIEKRNIVVLSRGKKNDKNWSAKTFSNQITFDLAVNTSISLTHLKSLGKMFNEGKRKKTLS